MRFSYLKKKVSLFYFLAPAYITIVLCAGYDTKVHLLVRLLFGSSGKCGLPLHCHYFQVHSDLVWWYLLRLHQINLFEKMLKMILMVRFQFWRSGKYGLPLHCHYSQVHSDLVWWYLLRLHQINL